MEPTCPRVRPAYRTGRRPPHRRRPALTAQPSGLTAPLKRPLQVAGSSSSPPSSTTAASRIETGLTDQVCFRVADVASLPHPDASFDVVLLMESACRMPDRCAGAGVDELVSAGAERGRAEEDTGGGMMRLGSGALFVFCFLDVFVVLSMLDVVNDAWPAAFVGSLIAFAVGLCAPTVHSFVMRRTQ
ncbi:methyltransferase domain-containing protein [Streptomyces sp. NPDC005953]|uniref:methyltransferase domain-containing protein n=1 Tax=Streptomyces sp. NPDC005953 TaxID=3156719 RepID=UPI0033D79FBF